MSVKMSKPIHLSGKSQADYLKFRGKERTSMFFKRGKGMEFIKAGSTFRRTRDDRTVETAKIISVATDTFGIPHVRYELEFKKPSTTSYFVDGPRVLALATFTDMYQERVVS